MKQHYNLIKALSIEDPQNQGFVTLALNLDKHTLEVQNLQNQMESLQNKISHLEMEVKVKSERLNQRK
jgi:peptidoglycan hydrolase CwlO-like protein